MRIAFDLDGVLADLHTPFVRMAVKLFPGIDPDALGSADIGASPTGEDPAQDAAVPGPPAAADVVLTARQSDAVWRAVAKTDDFWETLTEIEAGTIKRLAEVAEKRRWEVLFITSRPTSAGRTVQRQSQRWLQAMGFPLPSAYVVHGSRGRIAEALKLDVVVDDRPDNCLDVTLESKAGAVLVWRGAEGRIPASARRLGIAVVSDVAACIDKLIEADEANDELTLLGRLRKMFGLRTRSESTLPR